MKTSLQNNSLISCAVKGYEDFYRINAAGEVVTLKDGLVVKSRVDRAGYLTVRLSKEGKSSTHYVHRLVAIAFIANPDGKLEVNHINGNKLDNRIENLEWVTHAENVIHAYRSGLISRIESKQVIDICTGKVFSSVREAADCYSIPYSTCKNYLNGNRKNPTCLRFLIAQQQLAA